MKVTAHRPAAATKPAAEKTATTPAQVRALGKLINTQLANNDVGIDQSQTAGTDITNQTAPRGTAPKAAALYEKWAKAYDPRDAQAAGASLYHFNLQDISAHQPDKQIWGVAKWDDSSGVMVLFDKGGEIGRGKLDDNQLYQWAVRKS